MPRAFPSLWLYLSLLHTGLDTSSVSNSEGKYPTHLESAFPLSHPENTFQDTCSEQQGKGGEGSSDPVEWWGHFPSHWQCVLGDLFLSRGQWALGDFPPSGSPIMGSAQLLSFLLPEILKDHQKYWKSDCCQDRIKKQEAAGDRDNHRWSHQDNCL